MYSHSLINQRLTQAESSPVQIVNDGVIINTRFGNRSFRLSNIKPNVTRYAGYMVKAACLFGMEISKVAGMGNLTFTAPNNAKLLFQSLSHKGDFLVTEVAAGSCGNYTLTEDGLENAKCLTIFDKEKEILNIFGNQNICHYVFRELSPCLLNLTSDIPDPVPSSFSYSSSGNYAVLGIFAGMVLSVAGGITYVYINCNREEQQQTNQKMPLLFFANKPEVEVEESNLEEEIEYIEQPHKISIV